MSKSKKPKPIAVKKQVDPARARAIRRVTLHTLAALAFGAMLVVGVAYLRAHVEKRVVFPDRPPKVVLVNRPAWMSDFLAEQITSAVRPTKSSVPVMGSSTLLASGLHPLWVGFQAPTACGSTRCHDGPRTIVAHAGDGSVTDEPGAPSSARWAAHPPRPTPVPG